MNESSGGKGIWGILIIIIIIGGFIFVVFGGRIEFTKGLHERLFGETELANSPKGSHNDNTLTLVTPPKSVDWCKIQEIKVDGDPESPSRNRILGWDERSEACVIEYSGWSCAMGKETTIRYAYTGLIGGRIVWLTVDGVYHDETRYKDYVDDLDKSFMLNKPCNAGLY